MATATNFEKLLFRIFVLLHFGNILFHFHHRVAGNQL
jgi:hypothetical protein